MGFDCFVIFLVSLENNMLNHNAIAWYCLIIPWDDIERTKKKRFCACVSLEFEIDEEKEKMFKI